MGFPKVLGLSYVVEDKPSEFACTLTHSIAGHEGTDGPRRHDHGGSHKSNGGGSESTRQISTDASA